MKIALTAPERVARVMVADISPVAYLSGGHDDVFSALRAVDVAALESRREAEHALDPYIDDPAVKLFILKNLYRNEAGQFDWRVNVDVLQRCYDQMRGGLEADSSFDGDILFIKGGDSPYIQEKHREPIAKLFPHAQLKVIEGAGHWLHAEKIVAFNKVVETFLSADTSSENLHTSG